MKGRWLGALLLAAAVLAPSIGTEAAAARGKFWGRLKARSAGKWARFKVMRKGYLGWMVKRAAKVGHGAFSRLAREALVSLNGALGRCKGMWPNFRMALANLLAVRRGAGAALAGPLATALKALQGGCALVGQGGKANVITAIEGAIGQLKGKARAFYRRNLRTAVNWMKKGVLWARK